MSVSHHGFIKTQSIRSHLPLVPQGVCGDLGRHPLLVEGPQLAFIVHFDQLLAASRGEGDVELRGGKEEEGESGTGEYGATGPGAGWTGVPPVDEDGKRLLHDPLCC